MRNKLGIRGKKSAWARDYLLGRLTADARDAVDARLFADREAFEEMLAAQDDLVDDYVRSQLSRRDRLAFERAYQSTPERRHKVELARILLQHVDTLAPAHQRPRPFCTRPIWAASLSFALLLGVAGLVWELRKPAPIRNLETKNQRPASQPSRPVVELVLTAGLLRNDAEGKTLSIPEGAAEVELKVALELKGYSAFDAELKTPDGKVIWRGQNLTLAQQLLLSFRIPASLFESGDYVLSVSTTGHGQRVEAGEFAFRVSRRH